LKLLKPQPRYGNFSILQNGGRRHLGFLKLQILNGHVMNVELRHHAKNVFLFSYNARFR